MAKPEDNMQSEAQIATQNWQRYQYVKDRGHRLYVRQARRCEDVYLGGGLQWSAEDRKLVEGTGRPCLEINGVFPAVNTAIGMQLKSRVDISFKPRGASELKQDMSDILSKVTMQVCDSIKFPWHETQVFSDGMIQQRGFYDVRVGFDDNMQGNIEMEVPDPLDVLPDPDANSYDPSGWADVTVFRYMTVDDIAQVYGQELADRVVQTASSTTALGADDLQDRNRFGDNAINTDYNFDAAEDRILRIPVIDRQHRIYAMAKVAVYATTGEIIPLQDTITPEAIAELQAQGATITRRMVKRIRWTVTTSDVVLHDDWSPYRSFTIIPYFPYFRRGKTRGMVDNAISPQELLNKTTSQYLHITNTSANSGWTVEENTLVNMTPRDLEEVGSKTGLVIEHKKGSNPPQKIKPNDVPQGIDHIADKADLAIKTISGISDAMQGLNGPEVSGVAIQSKQYQGQSQLGGPMDNLARTRHLVAEKLIELIQDYYTEPRTIVITDDSDPSQVTHYALGVNQTDPASGAVLNDLTVGTYDVVVTDVPTQATFQDNQFMQAVEMRDKGIAIPDKFILAQSSLSKKNEIIKAMEEAAANQGDPLTEAKQALLEAQALKTKVEAVAKSVEAQYSAMQSAMVIATTPQTAPVADQLLKSAGFEDQDQPPIIAAPQSSAGFPPPSPGEQGAPQDSDMASAMPGAAPISNSNPLTPANPDVGMERGIETPENDGAQPATNNIKGKQNG